MRRAAKVINFGIIYGMSAFGLARELGVGQREAQEYIDSYFERHRAVREFMDGVIEEARTKGFVRTLLGRMRFIPELVNSDPAVRQLVEIDARYVPAPAGEHSLYIRPFMIASEAFLGVRAAEEVTFLVIASPVGPYFANGVQGVDIWVTDEWARAGQGGTGNAKCGGNYAASLIAQYEGYEHGCTQVMFIEATGKDRVEELGGMNVFLISKDNELVTPALSGTILDGITRDSILKVGAEQGLTPVERRLSAQEVFDGIADGTYTEAFCCGTAAVISPISGFKSKRGEWRPQGQDFRRTIEIRDGVLDIQYGRAEDTFGWLSKVV